MARRPKSNAEPKAGDQAATWEPVGSLVPWDRNPRSHAESLPALKRSIERCGFGSPIVARAQDRRIVAGHARWEAVTELGWANVPVRLMDLDEETAQILALADNAVPQLSEDDDDLIAMLADGLDIPGLDVRSPVEPEARSPRSTEVTEVTEVFWAIVRAPQAKSDAVLAALGRVDGVQISHGVLQPKRRKGG